MKMKTLKSIFAAAVLFAAGHSAQAQVTVKAGPELGFGFAYLYTQTYNAGEDDYFGGFGHIGGTMELQIGRFFQIRPSLMFESRSTSDGNDYYGSGDNQRIINNNLFLPVDFMYTAIGRRSGNKFFIGLGPYFAYTLGGSIRTDDPTTGYPQSRSLNLGSGVNDDMIASDIGIDFKLGFETRNGFFMNFGFNTGLLNRAPDNLQYYGDIKSSELFSFGLGYMFGKKEEVKRGRGNHNRGRGDSGMDHYNRYR